MYYVENKYRMMLFSLLSLKREKDSIYIDRGWLRIVLYILNDYISIGI